MLCNTTFIFIFTHNEITHTNLKLRKINKEACMHFKDKFSNNYHITPILYDTLTILILIYYTYIKRN